MNTNYKTILFDLDGTLIDSKDDIANCVNLTLNKLNIPTLKTTLIYSYIGRGVPHLMTASINTAIKNNTININENNHTTINKSINKSINIFRQFYSENLLNKTKCYPGVIELLENTTHIKKAIVTNKPENFTTKIIKGLNIARFFQVIIAGDSTPYKKPHPKPILQALENMNTRNNNAIMVGDSFADIESSRKANVKSCFVSYGFGSINSIKPDYYIHSINELKNIIH